MASPFDPADAPALLHAVAASQCRSSFMRLFAYYAPRVAAYARSRGDAADLAEELAQETMIAVWRKAGQYDPALATASAWIFTIARNRRVDRLRQSHWDLPETAIPEREAADPAPDTLLDAAERAKRIHAALASLPPAQTALIRMAFLDDRSHAEISKATGTPLGTVKSRIRLALGRLRAALDENE